MMANAIGAAWDKLLPFGLVLHAPVSGTVHFGLDDDLRVHVWWNNDNPGDRVTEIDLVNDIWSHLMRGDRLEVK